VGSAGAPLEDLAGLADATFEVVQYGPTGEFWYDFCGAKISNQMEHGRARIFTSSSLSSHLSYKKHWF
jgi:hypothetical protein